MPAVPIGDRGRRGGSATLFNNSVVFLLHAFVAQRVEREPEKLEVRGSRPREGTTSLHRLMVRTSVFQAGNAGSNPAGDTKHRGVAQPEARRVRDAEGAGSNPAISTNKWSVAERLGSALLMRTTGVRLPPPQPGTCRQAARHRIVDPDIVGSNPIACANQRPSDGNHGIPPCLRSKGISVRIRAWVPTTVNIAQWQRSGM